VTTHMAATALRSISLNSSRPPPCHDGRRDLVQLKVGLRIQRLRVLD
jgi:hypothetical protein